MNPVLELKKLGQSPWLDNISRKLLESGELKRLVKKDGISGVTSNPTIFDKAISSGEDYDDAMLDLMAQGKTDAEIYDALTVADIQVTADVLRPVFDAAHGGDGFVSLEVSPKLAHDTAGTVAEARRLYATVSRPNLFIKVPATQEGLPAIRQLLTEGVNVNITLMFSMAHYEAVAEAYIAALEDRVRQGLPLDSIASVASFFVSRVDTLVDRLLEGKMHGPEARQAAALCGKSAVANSKLVYQRFKEIFGSQRFKALAEKGARVQRVLWASTSTKNPAYSDVMYVEALIGPDTVNTLPDETIVAFRDHGKARMTVEEGVEESRETFKALAELGIDMNAVGEQLSAEGVDKFAQSFDKLFAVLAAKREKLSINRQTMSLGKFEEKVSGKLAVLEAANFAKRLWDKDASLWKPEPERHQAIVERLGWLTIPEAMLGTADELAAFADEIKREGYRHIVLLGMGGSSLAPEVYGQVFGVASGFPDLTVLDSTDPATIRGVTRKIDPARTLFIVSSKSGGTIETNSFWKYFVAQVRQVKGERAGENFIAITDPGTSLEQLARDEVFRCVFSGPADVGGRFSALTNFGLVPAALIGVDVHALLASAIRMARACGPQVKLAENPGVALGVVMGELHQAKLDKVTFIASPTLSSFGYWVEQLIAESTGKEGKGILPVEGEPVAKSPEAYSKDRVFVYLRLRGEGVLDRKVVALEAAGYPVVMIELNSPLDLAQELFRWEVATAVAGALLQIDPFDQPNVAESKDNTKRSLVEYVAKHKLPQRGMLTKKAEWTEALAALLKRVKPGDYVAIQAYIQRSLANDRALRAIRTELRDALGVATTVGYGPRFLHSTGQLHKGGPNTGVFIQITADTARDAEIPGEPYTFGALIRAQAAGDFQALKSHKRRAARIHLGDDVSGGLRQLQIVVHKAVKARHVKHRK